MKLPPVFVDNVIQAFGEAGRRYLADLPARLDEAARRWNLTLGEPFLLSYNYACAATLPDGRPAVLKIGVPNEELTSEIAALRLYAGAGACHLYAADPERGMLLEERLLPGTMLHLAGLDDESQTALAAEVMRRLWRPAPPGEPLLRLRVWFDELNRLRPRFGGETGPFPPRLVEAVESLLPNLWAESSPAVVLHGDCHHYNILQSKRGWLAIDPKGVVGPPEYEPAPLMLNPWGDLAARPEARAVSRRRLEILAERLGLDRQKLWAWAVCHSLLSAWWDLSANDTGGEYAAACGEMLLEIGPAA
ncbi:MAG: aminoglycoside phosphotransferase family protein [Anaerolineales bacterium]